MPDVIQLRGEFHGVTDAQWDQLGEYYRLLMEWNEKVNLTAITDTTEVYVKHFFDSLMVMQNDRLAGIYESAVRIGDVGTGAGFPGLVLALMSPRKEFVLVDSLAKRLKFLEAVVTTLGLQNVTLVHGRAEDIARQDGFRESFDLVVSRAVARLRVLSELTLPLVKVGGWLIAYKGPSAPEEVAEAQNSMTLLGGRQELLVRQELICEMGERDFIGIRKERKTPRQYPRKAGSVQKDPL